MRISVKVPKVKSIPEGYVSPVPHCKSSDVVRYGTRLRGVEDPRVKDVVVQRMEM